MILAPTEAEGLTICDGDFGCHLSDSDLQADGRKVCEILRLVCFRINMYIVQ